VEEASFRVQIMIRLLLASATQVVSVSAETKTPRGALKLLSPLSGPEPNWALGLQASARQVPPSQTGVDPEQSVFDAHSLHAPLVQNGVAPEQLVHAAPPAPQALALLPSLQVVPSQQPFGQFSAPHAGEGSTTQMPAEQVALREQRVQALPPVPQATRSSPIRQVVPSQQPEQFARVHFALLDAVHSPSMQARPSWQLKFSMQNEPDGFAPPSHRPSVQRPEQQWSALVHVIQFGLQRHVSSAQYFVQHWLSFVQRFAAGEPSPQGPSAWGRPFPRDVSRLPAALAVSTAPPSSTPRTAASPARREVAAPRTAANRSNRA
jgi:hypothetical protein